MLAAVGLAGEAGGAGPGLDQRPAHDDLRDTAGALPGPGGAEIISRAANDPLSIVGAFNQKKVLVGSFSAIV